VTSLDTPAVIWRGAEPGRLGKGARRALEDARRIGVPAIACLEVAAPAQRGRITLDRPPLDWMQAALSLPRVAALRWSRRFGHDALTRFDADHAERGKQNVRCANPEIPRPRL
jgi:PIN domain nuclease of toxin-antitoxin system